MLVLTRKRDETIKIGSDIVIRVMKTAKGSVKIGIEAPDSVRILRGEIATFETEVEGETEVEYCVHDEEKMDDCMLCAMLVQS